MFGLDIDGAWTEWHPWHECSTTCGPGTAQRYRYCMEPVPLDGGAYCPGDDFDTMPCDMGICTGPVDGVWSIWGDWDTCTATSLRIGFEHVIAHCQSMVGQIVLALIQNPQIAILMAVLVNMKYLHDIRIQDSIPIK